MKLSLRNLALGAAVAVAGAAMAQEAPFTVTQNWYKQYTGNTINEYRFGTGFGGKVIATNKTAQELCFFDANGVTSVSANGATGVHATHDEAGNILFHRSWAGANDCVKWTIYNPTTQQFTDLDITIPADAGDPARMDNVGRVIGDVLSEEGGIMLFTPNGKQAPFIIKIANGQQVDVDFTDYAVAESGPYAFDSTTLGAFTVTMEELAELGDEWANGVAIRKRGGAGNVPYMLVDGEWKALPGPANVKSSEGFDMFTLGDKLYEVVPAGDVNYTTKFAILDVETGETVYNSDNAEVSLASPGYGSIVANKVSDNKVEIYIFGQTANNPGITYTGMWTVEIPGEQPVAPLYAVGNFQNWSPENAAEFTYADGIYTLELTNEAIFKISTSKGSWDEFNAGVIGIAEDNQTVAPKLNTPVALTAGKLGNISVVADGAFTVKVDLNAMTLEIVGTAPTYTYFADDFEWLAPWAEASSAGATIEENNHSANSPQLVKAIYNEVAAYDALLNKGYSFLTSKVEGKKDQTPGQQIYINKNYLKFGKTDYFSGITLPAVKNVPAGANVTLSFDASSQRRGTGMWDPTELVVIVKNGEDVKTYPVVLPRPADTEGEPYTEFKWEHLSVVLEGAIIDKNTTISIRNSDAQWPGSNALRWFMDNVSLTGDAEPLPVMPDLYLRGEFNKWGTTTPMTLTEEPVECIGAIYRLHLDELEAGEFKIANEDWSINRGADADPVVALGTEMKAWNDGQNFKVEKKLVNVDITLFYKHDASVNSILTVEGTVWEAPKHRAAMAYDLSIADNGSDNYSVTFKSSDEGQAAIVLTNQADAEDVATIELGAVVKGENTLAFSAGDLKGGTYNWAIEIISNIEGEAPVLVYAGETPKQVVRGGVVTITDETVPSYGYTIVSHGNGQGFDVYTPAGEHVGTYHKGFSGFDSDNQSSPFRGAEREGLAVFADWSDKGAGYWVIDPLNPTNEPYNILAAPGATKAGSGLWTTAEGVVTAGGTAAIAFQGKGDDTVMYGFEEDRPDAKNVVVAWPIGSAQYLTVAPKMIFSGAAPVEGSNIPTNEGGVNTKSRLANHNVDILAIENGFFCSQVRDNGKEPDTPPFIYVSNDGQEIMNAAMEEIMESATAGIAITKDRSLFAASMKDAIRFFTIEWDETGFPVMTKLADVEVPGLRWAQMRFDAANNLHVYARECGGYQVYALNGEGTASTAAPVELAITKQGDGISDIAVDAANGDAVYYNLNGVRIAAENLTPGVYVKVVNGKASKVVVK